tara:strand:- start:178 stop:732 length:555 start_codon:yes stop_codon:yes gene_type:complete
MGEIIELRSFKTNKKYRYLIKNISSVTISLASPATSMALPLAGDASNILTKAEGNTIRVSVSWVIHDEETDVVLQNPYDEDGNNVGGGTTPVGFGSDTGVVLADNQVKFLLNNQADGSSFTLSGFQSTYIEDKYQIILGNVGFSRVGLIESIEITKSGDQPITWNATLNFVAGAVVAAAPEGSE